MTEMTTEQKQKLYASLQDHPGWKLYTAEVAKRLEAFRQSLVTEAISSENWGEFRAKQVALTLAHSIVYIPTLFLEAAAAAPAPRGRK